MVQAEKVSPEAPPGGPSLQRRHTSPGHRVPCLLPPYSHRSQAEPGDPCTCQQPDLFLLTFSEAPRPWGSMRGQNPAPRPRGSLSGDSGSIWPSGIQLLGRAAWAAGLSLSPGLCMGAGAGGGEAQLSQ